MEITKDLLAVTAENVYTFVSNLDIFRKYSEQKMKFNTPFSSPFRNDKNPSFVIYEKGFFVDFATGQKGNAITFLMTLNNINFNEALNLIVKDFGLYDRFSCYSVSNYNSKIASFENARNSVSLEGGSKLSVRRRDFNEFDKEYWSQYNIDENDLVMAKIVPISHFFIDTKMFISDRLSYAFLEKKDGVITYKIYQPKNKFIKWINGNDGSVWELWDTLPIKGKNLIITSSRKDALCIIKNLKTPSTARQSETVSIKPQVMEELHQRFPWIYLLLDNDFDKKENWGQKAATILTSKYPYLINVALPSEYGCKDFSDLMSKFGKEKANAILINEIVLAKAAKLETFLIH
jgi:hypothetical protein